MSFEGKLSSRFRVGKKFVCTLTFEAGAMTAEWCPMPRRLKQRDLVDYRAGRDAFMAEIAKAIGGAVLTVEPGAHETRFSVARPDDALHAGGSA